MNPGVSYIEPWRPTRPIITNGTDNRSAGAYEAVVKQFEVGTNPRYKPRNGNTYCNIFTWDVTRAMCAEIPHYVDKDHGDKPLPMTQGPFVRELNANRTARWMKEHGADYGWKECTFDEARAHASIGQPTVLLWDAGIDAKGQERTGHVAIVIPSVLPGLRIAQSGATNAYDIAAFESFPDKALRLGIAKTYWHP